MGIDNHELEDKYAIAQPDGKWIAEQKIGYKLKALVQIELGLLSVREFKLF